MSKKIILIFISFLFCLSFSFATEEKIGEAYNSNIDAFINGKFITSYNIDGMIYINVDELYSHGFDLRWNKKLNEYDIVSNDKFKENLFILDNKSEPLLMNLNNTWYKKWIKSLSPNFTAGVTPHGDTILDAYESNGSIDITFNQLIAENYLTKEYIKVYSDSVNVSDKFDYQSEDNALKLTLINKDFINNKTQLTVYLLDGIKTREGQVLKTPLKYMTFINEKENNEISHNEYLGELYKTSITAVVNNNDATIFKLKNKLLIPLNTIGAEQWHQEDRTIRVKSDINGQNNRELMLYNYSVPVFNGEYKSWIKDTLPKMIKSFGEVEHEKILIQNIEKAIQIEFNKDISTDCINDNFIKIFHGSSNQSEKFNYIFDEEKNLLTLELADSSRDIITPLGYMFDNNKVIGRENMEGRNYDIYILKGLRTKDDEKLDNNLRFTAGIIWQSN